jgi:hypothetical protein
MKAMRHGLQLITAKGRSRLNRRMCRTALLATTLFISGCQSDEVLKAASKYGELSGKAEAMFPVIAQDIVSSCIRQASLRYLDASKSVRDLAASRDAARSKCISAEAVTVEAMSDINKLILRYLSSLSGLADDKIYDKEITALGGSIKGLPGMNDTTAQQTIDAGTTIATAISKYLTRAYRATKLREAVIQSDQALSRLVYALSTATFYGYVGGRNSDVAGHANSGPGPGLNREYTLLGQYYGEPIRDSMLHLPRKPYQGYIEVTLNNKWIEEQNKVDERRAFAVKYLGLLKDIACDHTALRLMIEKRSAEKLSDVNPYCKSSADGGLPVGKLDTINNSALESQLVNRLTQYRDRMSSLVLQYDRIYAPSSRTREGGS